MASKLGPLEMASFASSPKAYTLLLDLNNCSPTPIIAPINESFRFFLFFF